jgi:hypothetical protein
MRYSTTAATYIIALAMAGAIVAPRAFAANNPKDEMRKACNAAGGELLIAGETGPYGCISNKGGVILCSKNGNCASYTPSRSWTDQAKMLELFKVAKVTPAETKCCTGVDIGARCVDQPKSGGCPADTPVLVSLP